MHLGHSSLNTEYEYNKNQQWIGEGDTQPPKAFSSSAATANVKWSLCKFPTTCNQLEKITEIKWIKHQTFIKKSWMMSTSLIKMELKQISFKQPSSIDNENPTS